VLSECARATTVEEARFRVDYPNSNPRRTAIIALDAQADSLVRKLAEKTWNGASFMTIANKAVSHSVRDWLTALTGETLNLLDEVRTADLVVTVSTAGESSEDTTIIAEACDVCGIMTTALVIDPASASESMLLETMLPLRARASMLVVAEGEEYVEAMLTALRA
jgi:hypothetical protein